MRQKKFKGFNDIKIFVIAENELKDFVGNSNFLVHMLTEQNSRIKPNTKVFYFSTSIQYCASDRVLKS